MKTCTGGLTCSSGELKIMNVLDELGFIKDETYYYDESYDNLKDKTYLRWDFRIEADEPIFIEYDGENHYLPIRRNRDMTDEEAKHNMEELQRRDKMKDDYCNDKGYLLLRIPYWEKEDIEELVKEFINDNLIL